jgi:hypothetical protein
MTDTSLRQLSSTPAPNIHEITTADLLQPPGPRAAPVLSNNALVIYLPEAPTLSFTDIHNLITFLS